MSAAEQTATDQFRELEKLWNTKEDLDPELRSFVIDGPFGPALNHPLVQSMVVHPVEHAMFNKALREKRKALHEARRQGRWSRFVFLHERPYRMRAFLEVKQAMPDKAYWSLLGSIWTDSDNIWQHRLEWLAVLNDAKRNLKLRPLMMNRDERKALAALPDTLSVFRGGSTKSKYAARNGMSWTLDLKKARWFATRLLSKGEKPLVFKRTVPKAQVIAHFTGRDEDEVLVLPHKGSPPQEVAVYA